MSSFEALMLICFGISWPMSILKTLKTKVVDGKSPLFLSIVFLGYIFGITHKCLYSVDLVLILYVLNFIMVGTDLFLYFHYRGKKAFLTVDQTKGY